MILQNKSSTFRTAATFIIGAFFGGSGLAWAGGYYTCASPAVLVGTSSCSDGSIARFHADPVCRLPETLQNHVCVAPTSTCTLPQVLVDNVCVTPTPIPTCIAPQVLQDNVCVTPTVNLSNEADIIFNWAEQDYPQYFPSHETTQISDPWFYRYYQQTNTYVGVNNQDNGVYVLGGTFGPTPLLVNTVANLVKVANVDPSSVFGVWHTSIPGGVWTSPGTYTDWLHISTGVADGDLIIRPDGTYIWNSYGGKSGSWVRGDSVYPVVLIDTVENRQWKVGLDSEHSQGRDIMIWDGRFFYYNGRK